MTIFISAAISIFIGLIAFCIMYVWAVRNFGREDSIGIGLASMIIGASCFFGLFVIMVSTPIIELCYKENISLDDCPLATEIAIEDISFMSGSHNSIAFIALDGTYHDTMDDNSKLEILDSPDDSYHIISAYREDEWMTKGNIYLLAVQVPNYGEQAASEVMDTLASMRLAKSNIDFIDVEGDDDVNE